MTTKNYSNKTLYQKIARVFLTVSVVTLVGALAYAAQYALTTPRGIEIFMRVCIALMVISMAGMMITTVRHDEN